MLPDEEGKRRTYRRGACENCGATSHRTKECVERPRKKGAKWTGKDIAPDEFLQTAELGFEGKRDRWAGYDAEEYVEVMREWGGQEGEEGDKRPTESTDDELYAESVDMPGQKVDLKTRMTIRNLRLREDTAKYLRDLHSDVTLYDPKTRSMRTAADGEGKFVEGAETDALFAWERPKHPMKGDEDRVNEEEEDVNDPDGRKRIRIDPKLEEKYAPIQVTPLRKVEESDTYCEYDKDKK